MLWVQRRRLVVVSPDESPKDDVVDETLIKESQNDNDKPKGSDMMDVKMMTADEESSTEA
jgi:hypothetical protein